ncbi:hypothetical protein A2U01_0114102, partial [Trifolium medium]|nr:hypothetical protein [Trifolium medium]
MKTGSTEQDDTMLADQGKNNDDDVVNVDELVSKE